MLLLKCDKKLLRAIPSQSFCQSVFTKDSCLCTAHDFNKGKYF